MCYWWYSLPPPSGDCWESSLAREHTPEPCRKGTAGMLSASDKWEHRGSRLHSRLIVLEALICRGSAGNQVGICSALSCLLATSVHVEQRGYLDIFTLCPSAAPSGPPPHEDALMIKLFLVCLCCSVWRWAHPPYLFVSPSFSVCLTKPKPRVQDKS